MFDKEAIQALQEGAAIEQASNAVTSAFNHEGVMALPDKITLRDLEGYMPYRRRARGVMITSDMDSFKEYTLTHKQDGATVFVDANDMSAGAVLNLGAAGDIPGHADNKALLKLEKTAAYKALIAIADGNGRTQKGVAEFLEDWANALNCFSLNPAEDAPPVGVKNGRAIAAIRNLSIESMRKLESNEQALSASKSVFESARATSAETIPTFIHFSCVPYQGLCQRTFVLRLGVLTGESVPKITLRIVNEEEHKESMALELVDHIKHSFDDGNGFVLPVLIGSYMRSN